MTNASYYFTHRPEGWSAACEVEMETVSVSFYPTELECREALNRALADRGLHKHMLFSFCG